MYKNYKSIEFVKPGGLDLKDKLVGVQRVTKVTKGGRAFGFSAIVVVGDEDGIEGSICNVSYSAEVLTKEKIATYYNLLINKNPPLNNIM